VVFLDIAPDIGAFSYLNRFNARSLVLRGYRTALRSLTEAKERGVFDDMTSSDPALN
jgi:NTE family protein